MMKLGLIFCSAVFWAGLNSCTLAATPPDTLVVQTFTFEDIESRRGVFEFPAGDNNWQKILMHYTLKCDEATVGDSYPCGEWDVTTHTQVHVHTGVMDSTLHTHPFFEVEGDAPESFSYCSQPRFHYFPAWTRHETPRSGDQYLRFAGTDCINVPSEALATVDSSITISFWVRGSGKQPQNDHLLEAGYKGGRVINIHLPWGTGAVYWDAGGRLGGNNNRLAKQADPGQYKGRWNHWAFTKDVATGTMSVYLNGELWHQAGNMTKTIDDLDVFIIGANLNCNGGWFEGDLDEVRIWDIALDQETIAAWRQNIITPQHPAYRHLRAEYRFDEMEGERDLSENLILDSSPHGFHGTSSGQPQSRPHGLRGLKDSKPGSHSVVHTDSIVAARVSIKLFENRDNPDSATSVMNVWPAYDSYFDGDGNLLEERAVADPEKIEQKTWSWYGKPFEKIEAYEMARFITPYGKGLDLGETGFTWICDVSDYAPLLQGKVDLQGANTYELLDLKFIFIGGTAPRQVRQISNLWPMGDYGYRDIVDDKVLQPLVLDVDPGADGFLIRSRISGHGHYGPENCCEWDAKDHLLLVGGIERFRWNVWRDCGMNPVYPQGGTWQFDRAGWCPGTFVDTYDHELTPLVKAGNKVVLDYSIEPYDSENGEADGRFVVSHQLFTYGPPSFTRDAAVLDVLAPSNFSEYGRLNPVSGEAVVKIANLGAETLTSLQIQYGLVDGKPATFHWQGALAFLASETVILPSPDWTGMVQDSRFEVSIERPNGETDQQVGNNRLTVQVTSPHLLPQEFIIEVESPRFERAKENSYTIVDRNGCVMASRQQFEDGKTYRDRIRLEPGAYTFEFLDTEEDGLIRHWWLRGSEPEKIGENGALRILDSDGEQLLDLGYDFAEKCTLRFFVGLPD